MGLTDSAGAGRTVESATTGLVHRQRGDESKDAENGRNGVTV